MNDELSNNVDKGDHLVINGERQGSPSSPFSFVQDNLQKVTSWQQRQEARKPSPSVFSFFKKATNLGF